MTLHEVVREASQYQSVLEIGCGTGHYIGRIKVPRRVGVDVHPRTLEAARVGVKGVEFVQWDLARLPGLYGPDEFECIVGFDIIEHFNRAAALALLRVCELIASRCLMFFIPVGNHPQTRDDRGLGNDYYQTHRSSWYPEDMKNLGYEVWFYPKWHKNIKPPKEKGAMVCRKLLK